MSNGSRWVVLIAMLLLGTLSYADIKDIRQDKLPKDPAIQSAYTDVAAVENMVQVWSQDWKYPVPKDQVIARVNSSLAQLQKAAKASPENEELLLLTGLVAHYSYNLDVQANYQVAVAALEKAAQLVPDDYRPRWFLGNHQCQAASIKQGMEKLLHVEQQLPWNKLPASFWDDYLSCAHLSNMPAHALQAADRANQLDPQNSNNRAFLVDASHKRFKAPDATAVYEAKEAWHATHIGSDIRFTSPMFGMEFSMPGEWKLSVSGIENGVANVVIKAGPYPGRSGPVIPNVSIMARPAKPGETLADFLKTAFPNPSARPTTVPVCPARACLAIERVEPNEYKGEGDGHLTIVVFQRDEPEYPGLIFEEPIDLPKTEGSGAHYFHADERLHRLPGTLYYLVAVDTADSVLTQARDVYSSFLKSMRVE